MPSKLQTHRRRAFELQGGRCFYCNVYMWLQSPSELPTAVPSPQAARHLRCTAEHVEARSQGGPDSASNIAAACARCNHTRHRRRRPPESDAYLEDVRRRVGSGKWHPRWVHDQGLLAALRRAKSD